MLSDSYNNNLFSGRNFELPHTIMKQPLQQYWTNSKTFGKYESFTLQNM